ncbi:MAG: YjjG family noncanonical pyrimidine nucleotidase [Cyclobacteriaceae bacterium]
MNTNGSALTAKNNNDRRAYKCIFFDLDHTLWDYECNARDTLLDLHTSYNLQDKGIIFEDFHKHFKIINFKLWELYDRGLIENEVIRYERFKQVLEQFKVREEKLSEALSHEYLYGCPKKAKLVPYAKEVLEYLSSQYTLTVVTNGFEEIQTLKLLSGNITHYFDHVITSQKAGYKKPAREIFDYALSVNNLRRHEVIMIGDNLITDIGGARNACIDTVFYNPDAVVHSEKVSHEIRCLSELQNIL